MRFRDSINSYSVRTGVKPLLRRMLGQSPPPVELLSLHVPKAAGTSFRGVLQAVYGENAVWSDYGQYVEDPELLFRKDPDLARRIALDRLHGLDGRVRVIHGHFPLGKYGLLPPGVKRITWLRHPLARLASHYYFWLTTDRHGNPVHDQLLDQNLSLIQFARLPAMRDFMLGNLFQGADLVDLDFIGMQEYYDEDLADLALLMGWGGYPAVRRNTGRLSGYDQRLAQLAEDGELIAELVDLNRGDMELYRRVAGAKGRQAPDNPWLTAPERR